MLPFKVAELTVILVAGRVVTNGYFPNLNEAMRVALLFAESMYSLVYQKVLSLEASTAMLDSNPHRSEPSCENLPLSIVSSG